MDYLLLATEATEAATDAAEGGTDFTVVLVILVAGLVAFGLAWFIVGPGRNRKTGDKREGDIPLAMRPYHSDEELETVGMERAMAWGVALSLFAGVFLAAYWLIEPARINDKVDGYYEQDVNAGAVLFVDNCATCHGNQAGGGAAPNPYGDAPWPAPNLTNIAARYEGSEIVTDIEEFIVQTLKQGRAGTPMPAWGSAYNGPLNDFQINQLTRYLLSIQTGEVPEVDAAAFTGQSGMELYANNCARCHGDELQGQVGPALNTIYGRYGADLDDPSTFQPVRDTILGTLINGRNVPTVGQMPSFAEVLPEEAMESIIDYIESQQVPGGPPYGQVGPATDTVDEATATPTEDEE